MLSCSTWLCSIWLRSITVLCGSVSACSARLGIYLYYEPGRIQIDEGQWDRGSVLREVFSNVSDYADAANKFVASLSSSWSMQDAKNLSIPVFTSDWAFYWFDYLAGYDTILAELEVNHSRTQQIALCRGAARAQGKDWGAIITWTYNDPPYMDTGPEMLDDRLTAFRAGAKYVIVFNYPRVNEYGALREEQFLGYAAVLEPHSRFPEKHFWNNRWRGCFCAAQELWVRHELAR